MRTASTSTTLPLLLLLILFWCPFPSRAVDASPRINGQQLAPWPLVGHDSANTFAAVPAENNAVPPQSLCANRTIDGLGAGGAFFMPAPFMLASQAFWLDASGGVVVSVVNDTRSERLSSALWFLLPEEEAVYPLTAYDAQGSSRFWVIFKVTTQNNGSVSTRIRSMSIRGNQSESLDGSFNAVDLVGSVVAARYNSFADAIEISTAAYVQRVATKSGALLWRVHSPTDAPGAALRGVLRPLGALPTGDALYECFTCYDAVSRNPMPSLYLFASSNGSLIWRIDLPQEAQYATAPGSFTFIAQSAWLLISISCPLLEGVFAYDALDGKLMWSSSWSLSPWLCVPWLPPPPPSFSPSSWEGASMALVNRSNSLLVAIACPQSGEIALVEPLTGTLVDVWRPRVVIGAITHHAINVLLAASSHVLYITVLNHPGAGLLFAWNTSRANTTVSLLQEGICGPIVIGSEGELYGPRCDQAGVLVLYACASSATGVWQALFVDAAPIVATAAVVILFLVASAIIFCQMIVHYSSPSFNVTPSEGTQQVNS